MIVLVNEKVLGLRIIKEFECVSADDVNNTPVHPVQNLGSTMLVVDTGDVYKFNLDSNGMPKWYKL